MSRIEEIRKRLEDSKHVYFSASEEEVSYLLSQLDIAINTLVDIKHIYGSGIPITPKDVIDQINATFKRMMGNG